jgi:acetylornithine deacetylase/succinyl-diaminopimelate desuccinylase-like protein
MNPDFVRRARRAATHMTVAALLASTCGQLWARDAPQPPADMRSAGREILKELVGLRSVHSKGTTPTAHWIADRLAAGGFASEDIHFLAPESHPAMGNVVVRLRGSGKNKPIQYIGHLDVVEAKREDWNFDPFVLTEKEGWLYGRGTIDMLGQDSAMLASLLRLKKEGFVPDRDIIVAFTADEEAGAVANGVDFLLTKHRALVDASLAINPDGGEAALKNGRKRYLSVQSSEKIYLTFAVEVTDKGGHGSRPTAGNPIYRLAKGLDRLSGFEFPVRMTATTKLYFAGRAGLESGQTKLDMQAVSGARQDRAAVVRLSREVETNIMLRTTCTVTGVEGGHAENALPQRARATIQCRLIPGETQESVQRTLAKVLADPSISISVMSAAVPSPESAPTPAILKILGGVVDEMWPGVAIIPNMSAGASDSIYTRAAGIPTYGIDAMFDDLDDGRAHGRDERIGVKVFDEELEFTYRLMKALSQMK